MKVIVVSNDLDCAVLNTVIARKDRTVLADFNKTHHGNHEVITAAWSRSLSF